MKGPWVIAASLVGGILLAASTSAAEQQMKARPAP